jgi:hypothetical protein
MHLRLPHRWLVPLVERVRQQVTRTRQVRIAGTDVAYRFYEGDADTTGLTGCYDESGIIFVSEDVARINPWYADLVAYHEHLEITAKRAGSSHARAHRRALVGSLLATRTVLPDPEQLHAFLVWQIGIYSRAKVPDPDGVIAEVEDELGRECVRKGRLLEVITRHML